MLPDARIRAILIMSQEASIEMLDVALVDWFATGLSGCDKVNS